MTTKLDPELERRIVAMESGVDQGAGFTALDKFWLLLLGVIGPAALIVWGWIE